MGFFKDSKDAIKGAKELGDYHGGMPSMSSALKDVKAVTDDRGQNEILQSGTPAKRCSPITARESKCPCCCARSKKPTTPLCA